MRRTRRFLPALLLLAACGGGGADPSDASVAAVDASIDAATDATPGSAACPVSGYVACGGALEGTWSFAGMCPESPTDVPCEGPFSEAACQGGGNQVSCALAASGTMTFTATDVHVVRDLYADATYVFTPACLAAVKPDVATPEARCAALANPPKLACSFAADACTCVGHVGPEPSDDTVPYTASGTQLTIGDVEPMGASYCVQDGRLTIDFDPHPLSWRYWVLDKP
jgi:hypothetical protein